jgi:hypothetical protein
MHNPGCAAGEAGGRRGLGAVIYPPRAERLRCLRCGCRNVAVIFEPPATHGAVARALTRGYLVNWLQFIASIVGSLASIVGSLALPGLLFALWWFNRGPIANLIAALIKLKLPGGTELEFGPQLAKATLEADRAESLETGRPQLGERIPIQPDSEAIKGGPPDWPPSLPPTASPQYIIITSFAVVERTLDEIRLYIKSPCKETALAQLLQRGIITTDTMQLYDSVRRARDAMRYPSFEEAQLFMRNAHVLHTILQGVLEKLKAKDK